MKSLILSGLTAISFGVVAAASLPGSAHADDDGFDYRIIGCLGPNPFPGPVDPEYDVSYSTVPDDIGRPCETVLSSLGDQGFRLIEVRPVTELEIGILHYLQRDQDD